MYVIIAGERRFRAAVLCGWTSIACDVKADDIGVGEIAEIQLAENHARKDLNPIELARAFQDVVQKNDYKVRDLARRMGVNETTVTRYVRLLSLPRDVQRRVAKGEISVGVAREAARLNGETAQRAFLEKAIEQGYSATEAQRAASDRKNKRRRSKAQKPKSFTTEYGQITVTPLEGVSMTYEHLESMLTEVIEEVRHRIRNGARW